MLDPHKSYWFPAKRYGYGWGPPSAWQGWGALLLWSAAVGVLTYLSVYPTPRWGLFSLCVVGMASILVLICWWKGEPLRRRQGGESTDAIDQ